MAVVRDLLRTKKDGQIWSIAPEATVYEAMQMLAEKKVGALLVMEAGRVVGIVSERDCVRKVDIQGRTSPETQVSEIMTPDVIYIEAGQPLEDCMIVMTEKKIRHLPVYDGGELVGIVSVGDVLKQVISEQKFTIEQLVRYITGGGR